MENEDKMMGEQPMIGAVPPYSAYQPPSGQGAMQGGYPPAAPGQGGYPAAPPPGGYPPPPGQPGYPPTVVSVQQQPATQVVVVGNCPTCHAGVLADSYTACGIILAICFFPLGIICCLMMKERRCTNCGSNFG